MTGQPFALAALQLSYLPHYGSCISGHLAARPALTHVARGLPPPLLTTFWALLEIEAFTDLEPVAFHVQLPISILYFGSWKPPHKLATATKASFRQDGAKPGFCGIFHLQERVAFPVLSPLSDGGGGSPHPQTPGLRGKPRSDELNEKQWNNCTTSQHM